MAFIHEIRFVCDEEKEDMHGCQSELETKVKSSQYMSLADMSPSDGPCCPCFQSIDQERFHYVTIPTAKRTCSCFQLAKKKTLVLPGKLIKQDQVHV